MFSKIRLLQIDLCIGILSVLASAGMMINYVLAVSHFNTILILSYLAYFVFVFNTYYLFFGVFFAIKYRLYSRLILFLVTAVTFVLVTLGLFYLVVTISNTANILGAVFEVVAFLFYPLIHLYLNFRDRAAAKQISEKQ